MPKRSKDEEDSDDYIKRKMRKIEKKLRKRKKRSRNSHDSDTESNCASPVLSRLQDSPRSLILDPIIMSEGTVHPPGNLEPISGTPTLTESSPEDTVLTEDIIELLGVTSSETKKTGANIQKDIALRWQHIATKGLTKEDRKSLLDKHFVPGNCQKISAPILNPEIKAALTDTLIGKDKATCNKQNQVTSVLACIGDALTNILRVSTDNRDTIKSLLEGGQLLCDLQYTESMKRRSIICASIKKELKNQLYETDINSFLFGENLTETLRAAKAINKAGSDLKVSKQITNRGPARTLNSKPQLANSRQPVRRRQEQPAAYSRVPANQSSPALAIRRQYAVPPPPPPPPPPLPTQQRYKARQYQRR